MTLIWLLLFYSLLTCLVSFVGGSIPVWINLTHRRMELAISLVAGVMLGVGVLHLLPHAVHELNSLDAAVHWLLAGLLGIFLLERFLCFHHHDVDDDSHSPPEVAAGGPGARHTHKLTWGGAAIGLTLHSMLDGLAVAASTHANSAGGALFPGLATLVVVILHKPFDALTLSTLMAAGGWSRRAQQIANGTFSLTTPLGIALVSTGLETHGAAGSVIGPALAFSAGMFVCISLSDLLPELQFHQHDRIKLSLALALGLAVAWSIRFLEGSDHARGPDSHQEHDE